MRKEQLQAIIDAGPQTSWANWVTDETRANAQFVTNSCRYATKQEAQLAGHELACRWLACFDWVAVPMPDPINYRFENGRNERLEVSK